MKRILQRLTAYAQPGREQGKTLLKTVLVLLAGFAAGGAVSGAGILLTREQLLRLSESADSLYASPDFGGLFLRCFAVDAVYGLVCLAGALFALGAVVVWFSVFVRGLACGAIAGTLCVSHGIGGFAFYVIAVLPGLFISLMALCAMAGECGELARVHFRNYFGYGKQGIAAGHFPIRGTFFYAAFCLVAATVSAALATVFYRLL